MPRASRRAAGGGHQRPETPPDNSRPGQPVTVAVRVKPGSSRVKVGGRYDGPYGPALIVAVTAPAVDGRATEAARRALAEALELRPAAVELRAGAASRDKLFTVAAAAGALDGRLRRLRDGSAR